MLGPDAITEEVDGNSVSLMQLFVQHLRDKLPDAMTLPDQCNLAQVAQAFKNRFGVNYLRVMTEDFFRPGGRRHCQTLVDLAALPFKLVVSTVPGKQMEEAFHSYSTKTPACDWYHFNGPRQDMVHEGTSDKPLVYHLYGCIDELKSLVLAEDDLLDFLVNVISGNPPLPNNIRSAFKSKDNCFLFLGFGFKYWYLRILLHVLYKGGRDNHSFALEDFDISVDPFTVERTKLFFQEGHKIYFFDMQLGDFAVALRRRVETRQRGQAQEQEPKLTADAPKVFLCHASEDKAYAQALYERLGKSGIRPWLDVKNIRGGADWDHEIKRTIDNEIDYFIVLQSKALLEKFKGYVNKELRVALERQDYFRRDSSFIIPTFIEACGRLQELERLQCIDLTKPDGFEALVSAIERDYQIRKKRS
jgi:hypothetical protein